MTSCASSNFTGIRNVIRRSGILAAVASMWAFASVAVANINIELRPPTSQVVPNAIVPIGLYLVSDNASVQTSIAADVVFSWDNTRLQFLGIDNTGGAPVTVSALPTNSNLNEAQPPADGDGFYQMLGQFGSPVQATPAGTLLTTFRFRALSTACTGAHFTVLPSGGNPVRVTKVLDGVIPNFVVTGTLDSALIFIDGVAPSISMCAPPQMVAANGSCQGIMPDLTGLVVASDNCPNLTITQTPLVGTTLPLGPTNVTMKVTDPGGNMVTCMTSVTVVDQTGPNITQCASDATIAADATCQAAIPDLTGSVLATDACSPPVTITQSPTAGTMVGLGVHTVTVTATDALNNTSTCDADVTVEDQSGPNITQCASDATVAADATCQASIPDLTGDVIATDACSPPVTITQSPTAGTMVGLGLHSVTLTATDAANNMSTCGAVITVADQTDPDISQCAASQSIDADGNCEAAVPDLTGEIIASDNCTPSPALVVSQSPLAGTLAGLGPTLVTISVTDAALNTATCQATITVEDNTAPSISQCASAQTVGADENRQALIPDLTSQVIATDACSPPVVVTQSPTAGTIVGLGPHTVTLSATDAANNVSTCEAVVTVADQTDPVISQCAPSPTLAADATCQAAIPDLTDQVIATDICSPPVIITQSPTAGTLVGIGPHTVTFTATDAVGNSSTCDAVVTVEDQTSPEITQCAAGQTLSADANCQAAIPDLTGDVIATDVCSPPVTITQSPIAGVLVGIGPHNVTLTAEDAAGNQAMCIAVITVEDQTDPTISQCAGPQTLAADANCQAAIPDLTGDVIATDACSLPITISQSPVAGTLVGLGPTNVTITVEDAAGNEATCVAVVTVEDQTDPQITTCAGAQTLAAGPTCEAAIPDLTGGVVATDNCTPAPSLLITQSPTAGTMVGLGPHNVTITVADAAGNDTTCVAVITITDQTPPMLVGCPANIVTNTNTGNCAAVVTWTAPTGSDNCGVPTVMQTQGPAPGSPFASNSSTTIEYTATDAAGLTATCSFTVTVTPSPDMDNDGDVDVDDIPIFVNVLIGVDTTPLRVARADVNCDGFVDGRDVKPFTDILTP